VSKNATRRTQGTWFAVSLALVTVLGPAGTDMYLASLPDIAVEFSATAAQAHLSRTVYLTAMGAGQLVLGPLADAFGRKPLLLSGVGLFLVASVASAVSADSTPLLAARLIQGLAAAAVLVVARSVVRDLAEGHRAARLFALLMTIEDLAPVLAPTVGGFVDVHFGWRAVLSLVALVNSMLCLPETRPVERRILLRPATVAATYRRIAADRAFLVPALALSAVLTTALEQERAFVDQCCTGEDADQVPGESYCTQLVQRYRTAVHLRFLLRTVFAPPAAVHPVVHDGCTASLARPETLFEQRLRARPHASAVAGGAEDDLVQAHRGIVDSLHAELVHSTPAAAERRRRARDLLVRRTRAPLRPVPARRRRPWSRRTRSDGR
jgi:hypothetical protein